MKKRLSKSDIDCLSKEEIKMNCPFCKKAAVWCENKEIYGRNYGKSYMVWLCKPCDSYVGCHQNTKHPLGSMANRKTREWRKKAHAVIDPIWKSGKMKRKKVYELLGKVFGHEVHVGQSNIEMCKKIIDAAEYVCSDS